MSNKSRAANEILLMIKTKGAVTFCLYRDSVDIYRSQREIR